MSSSIGPDVIIGKKGHVLKDLRALFYNLFK